MKKQITSHDDSIKKIIVDKKVRVKVAQESHTLFFAIYLNHYVKYPASSMHDEFFRLTEDESIKLLGVVAFRGSAKSTIFSTSYALWSILGRQQKKFVIIFCQTRNQAKQQMMNMRKELENNKLLKTDLGPFQEEQDSEWGSSSLVFSNSGARITVASAEQSIRGIRHGEYRPDLIICDDVEDLTSSKTKEGRDKTYQWFTGEIVPAGDVKTKIVVIGNLLHEDSLLMRLKQDIESNTRKGVFRQYPLLNDNNEICWIGKYPTQESIENQKQTVGNESSWQREYLLRIVTDDDQVINPEWIKYYDKLPDDGHLSDFRYVATGIDLAISERESADYTAMVSGKIYGRGNDMKIFILPNPINERLTFPKTIELAKSISKTLGNGSFSRLYIEDAGYQRALIQDLRSQGIPAEEFKNQGQDKRARLTLTSTAVQSGKVMFPIHGADLLVKQLTGFGKERHDDLADAFSILILKAIENNTGQFFPEWNNQKHVVKCHELQPSSKLFRSIHANGRAGYTSCHWYALDHNSVVTVFREYYKTGLDADQHARNIAELSGTEHYQYTVMNREAFGGPSIGESVREIYLRNEVEITFKAPEDRKAGWESAHRYLRDDKKTGRPCLAVFDSCINLIRSMALISRSNDDINDTDKKEEFPAVEDLRSILHIMRDQRTMPPLNATQKRMVEIRKHMGLNPYENIFNEDDDELNQ